MRSLPHERACRTVAFLPNVVRDRLRVVTLVQGHCLPLRLCSRCATRCTTVQQLVVSRKWKEPRSTMSAEVMPFRMSSAFGPCRAISAYVVTKARHTLTANRAHNHCLLIAASRCRVVTTRLLTRGSTCRRQSAKGRWRTEGIGPEMQKAPSLPGAFVTHWLLQSE